MDPEFEVTVKNPFPQQEMNGFVHVHFKYLVDL